MWISKKKYEDLKRCVDQLMSMHDLCAKEYYSPFTRTFDIRFNRDFHKEPTIRLGDIDNLTFKELAEYVINGKPITRIREHEVVVCPKKECGEDTNNDGNN